MDWIILIIIFITTILDAFRDRWIPKVCKGKILAIEPESGDYFIGESNMEAAMQAKVKDVRLNKLTISEFTIIANNDNLKLNCVS